MPTVYVTEIERYHRALSGAAANLLTRVQEGVDARRSARGHAPPVAIGAVLEFALLEAAAAVEQLAAAEQRLDLEIADDAEPRARRDLLRESLRGLVIEAREAIAGAYGEAALTTLGIVGGTESDATTLLRQARLLAQASERLERLKARRGVRLNLDDLASELEPLASQLDASLRDVAREEAELKDARVHRDGAATRAERALSALLSTVHAALRLAGLSDEIARLPARTTARSSGPSEGAPPTA